MGAEQSTMAGYSAVDMDLSEADKQHALVSLIQKDPPGQMQGVCTSMRVLAAIAAWCHSRTWCVKHGGAHAGKSAEGTLPEDAHSPLSDLQNKLNMQGPAPQQTSRKSSGGSGAWNLALPGWAAPAAKPKGLSGLDGDRTPPLTEVSFSGSPGTQ